MSKISNVITMMELLSTGKKYSISELSYILEVTPRMVRCYKEELEKAGIYIDSLKGKYGGYVLNYNIRVPKRRFKAKDYKIIDDYIKIESDKRKKEELILLKDKIRGIYVGSNNEAIELNLRDENVKKYNILNRAIKERKKVKIEYYSYNHGITSRIIEPADMFYFRDGWYCAANCLLRGDMRHFELKRISKIELLNEIF